MTAIPRTCGHTGPPTPPAATWSSWAAQTRSWTGRAPPTPLVTSGGWPKCSTTSCSPSPGTGPHGTARRHLRAARLRRRERHLALCLSGAHELRHGIFGTPATTSPEILAALTPTQLFDALAIRVNGPCCWDQHVTIDVIVTDTSNRYRLRLRNGVLTHTSAPQPTAADAVVTVPRAALPALAGDGTSSARLAAAGLKIDGDASALTRLLSALDTPDPDFAIVTP
jgi:hypothetical protein